MKNYDFSVDVFHNILWSKYKGGVFSSLYLLRKNVNISFFQIAKTDSQREGLSVVDLSYHRYPYELLFDGSYDSIRKFRLMWMLARRVFSSKADIILLPGYHLPEYWVMLMACLLTGKKRAVFVDSTRLDRPASKAKDFLKRLFFKFCDGFFCYGSRSKEYLMSLGVLPGKIFYRCQAAALDHKYDPAITLNDRIQILRGIRNVSFLYVGRLAPEKGLDVLLKAFHKVYQLNGSIDLKIVGTGPLSEDLRAMAKALGLEDSVTLAGARDVEQLPEFYRNASCLILPSRSEPWGLVVNEAMSYGCPVIASDHCGCIPELIIEGKTGYAFRTDDEDDLAEKMEWIIVERSNDLEYAEFCVNHMKSFTPDKAAQQILDGCEKIFCAPEKK